MKTILLIFVLGFGIKNSDTALANSFHEFTKSDLTFNECQTLSSIYRTIGYQAGIEPYVSSCEESFSFNNIKFFKVTVKIPDLSSLKSGKLKFGYAPNLRKHQVKLKHIEDYIHFLGMENFRIRYLLCSTSWPCFMSPASVFDSSHGVEVKWQI